MLDRLEKYTPGYSMCRYCGVRIPIYPESHVYWCPNSNVSIARNAVIEAVQKWDQKRTTETLLDLEDTIITFNRLKNADA